MRVLQLIQRPQLRGAEVFASQLSNHLLEAGHEVRMIALLPGEGTLPFKGSLIRLNRPPSRRLFDVLGWKQLAGHIRAFQPDVVQANAGDTLKFAVFSKLLFGWRAPMVFRNANKVSDFINSGPKLLFNRFLVNRVAKVISVSELCNQDFVKTYSYDSSRIVTIPIGIEQPSVSPLPGDLRPLFAGKKVLVHVGSFVPEKNHEGLLRILAGLLQSRKDLHLILIGEGRLKTSVQHQVNELKLDSQIHFLGVRSDVLSILKEAAALVLPSKIEGLPGVILEAMYCRTPVIAYDVGGISEVVRSTETGWLVKAGDESGFASTVNEVLSHSGEWLETERAFDLVTARFDNALIAQRFANVYQGLNKK